MQENSYTVMLAKIRAFRATKDVIASSLQDYDVTIMQWLLLGSLDKNNGKSTAKEVAHELNVSMPFITRMTKVMESKGFIQIDPLEEDKRTKILSLTSKGNRLVVDSEPVVRQALKDWLSAIPSEDVKVYITVLLQVAYKI
jgi:DNA-binding MarR family transcriptional regulator